MVPETGNSRVFRHYLLYTPFEGDLYNVKGWKHTGLWRVTRVTSTHCFFEKFVGSHFRGSLNKKLLLSSWYKFVQDGRVDKFTKDSTALTGFQQACADWLRLGEDGHVTVAASLGAGKSYVAGMMMGAVLMAEGIPKK